MILVFFVLFLWFFSLLGLGIQTALFLKVPVLNFEAKDRITVWGILGFAITGFISVLFNFFIPISSLISTSYFILGIFLALFHYKKIQHQFKKSDFKGLLISIAFLSFFIASAKLFFLDTAVYHLQAIRWITESKTPMGLSNLIGKLGYNTLWFPTAAMLEILGLKGKSGFILNPLLFLFYLFPLFSVFQAIKEKSPISLSDVFLLSSILLFIYPFFNDAHIVSPSNDAPILILGLFLFYLLIKRQNIPILSFLLFLSAYLLMVKISAFPFLLAVLTLFYKKNIFVELKKISFAAYAFITAFLSLWVLRGIYSSTCPFYPNNTGCLKFLEWSAPESLLKAEYTLLQEWSRKPYKTASDHVLENWNWFKPWLSEVVKIPFFQISFFLFAFGIIGILYLKLRKNPKISSNLSQIFTPSILCIFGIIFWFSVAPDPRFGMVFIGGLSILLFSAVLQASNFLQKEAKQSFLLGILILIVCFLPILKNVRITPSDLINIPQYPNAETETYLSIEHKKINTPKRHTLCWNAPLPCASIPLPDLRMKTRPGERLPYEFYYDDAVKQEFEAYSKSGK